uniref:Uncharacterized protein n=1 Tax=viral metagenome TaxID=1070528 RepID=A0A6M3XXL7_9ZZZZ
MSDATERPWEIVNRESFSDDKKTADIYDADGESVCYVYSRKHARLIVTAVNRHDELVKYLQYCVDVGFAYVATMDCHGECGHCAACTARALLARIEEEGDER